MAKRTALVTGGMGGIGQAICRELHNQGMNVVAAYNRSDEAALDWQSQEKQSGFHYYIARVNVMDLASCEAMVQKVENEIGPIDILINNAGITRDNVCWRMQKDEWDMVINTDLNSIFLCNAFSH